MQGGRIAHLWMSEVVEKRESMACRRRQSREREYSERAGYATLLPSSAMDCFVRICSGSSSSMMTSVSVTTLSSIAVGVFEEFSWECWLSLTAEHTDKGGVGGTHRHVDAIIATGARAVGRDIVKACAIVRTADAAEELAGVQSVGWCACYKGSAGVENEGSLTPRGMYSHRLRGCYEFQRCNERLTDLYARLVRMHESAA